MNESMTPSMYIKPDYSADIEAWLAQGNQVTELSFGHSHFKDRHIPKVTVVKPLDIEKYNAKRVTKPTKAKAVKEKKPKKIKIAKVLKPKPVKTVKPKTATKLIVYSERSMIWMHNCKVIREARKNNLEEFEALCTRHGYTPFRMFAKRARCLKCDDVYAKRTTEDYKRRALNRELMNASLEAGQNNFLGICKMHGETEFYILPSKNTNSNRNYKCRKCVRISNNKYTERKKLEVIERLANITNREEQSQ